MGYLGRPPPARGYHLTTLEIRGQSHDVQAYRLASAIVWGMTERILTGLLEHLRD